MFVALIITTSVLIALARGGRLTNVTHIPLRFLSLLFVPLLLQAIAFSPIGEVRILELPLAQLLYSASLGLTALALWLNRHLPGVVWIALGLLLNFVVISLNGGFMPVAPRAREFAALPPLTGRDKNIVPMTDSTLLPWLADILPLPAFVPFANVFSAGDLLIVIGAVIFTQMILVPPKRRTDA